MTGDEDEDATGVPERTERTDSGAHVTESGRLVTNRNVVPRDRAASETSGLRDLRALAPPAPQPPVDDDFDVVTPVRPQPRDVFVDEDATLSQGEEVATSFHQAPVPSPTPVQIPAQAQARARTPSRTGGPRIMPSDAGFTPPRLRRPSTERGSDPDPQLEAELGAEIGAQLGIHEPSNPWGDERVTPAELSALARRSAPRIAVPDAGAPHETPPRRSPGRITPADVGFIPPESRRPGSDVLPLLDPLDPRRPSTARGHIEPRRRPTTPPPNEPAPAEPAPDRPAIGRVSSRPIGVSDTAAEASLADRPYARPRTSSSQPAIAPARDGRPPGATRTTRRLPAAQAPDADPAPGGPSLDDRPGRDQPRVPLPLGPSPYDPAHGRPLDPRGERARARRDTRPGSLAPRDRLAASPQLDGVLRGVTILVVLGLGVAGLAQPASVLRGGIAWLIFLLFVLSGWGAIVARIARVADPDAGQRTALGAAGFVAVAGVLVATGLLALPAVFVLLGVGFVGFGWRELTTPIALWQRIRNGLAFIAEKPALAAFAGVVIAVAVVRLVGAVGAIDGNPWDDDVAYTPMVKRLLDVGDLIEPFSFRRLGAYGGQTALQALVGARGSLASVHLLDKGLGFAVVLLGLVGYARERRTQPVWLALIALVLVVLPDTAINTASYWTGVVAFLALYRAIVREQWALAGLVAAMASTLRQNFLATAVLFVGCVLIFRFIALVRTMPAREAWQQERRGWALAAGTAAAGLAPWLVAAYVSSHTFLYPVLDGTWNHGLSLTPIVMTWPQELGFLVTAALEGVPIIVIPVLALALAFVIDRRPGRPLSALAIASILSFGLLVHGLVGSDMQNLWRYAFGFATVLVIALVVELGADDDTQVALPPLGRWVVLAALVLQVVMGRGVMPKQAIALLDGIREAAAIDRHGDPRARAELRRYAAMQAAVPAGARLIVMLDDPALLDYRRNPIANLDTPGYASPDPQLPSFGGGEPLRAYLIAQGYRYAAFVRTERSRYFFRREQWLRRMFSDLELFQIMAAYTIDAIDRFAELATTTRVLYDADGLVVLDLAAPLKEASRSTRYGDEPARRGAWVRELADREGLHDAWSLTTRADLRFEDGVAQLRYIDPTAEDPKWNESTINPAPGHRNTPALPLYRRAHLRVRGTPGRDMRLVVRAAIGLNLVYTHPRLDISLDGELVASGIADAAGRYTITAVVPRDQLGAGWHDVYLVFSSMADPDRELRDPRIARLEAVEWAPP